MIGLEDYRLLRLRHAGTDQDHGRSRGRLGSFLIYRYERLVQDVRDKNSLPPGGNPGKVSFLWIEGIDGRHLFFGSFLMPVQYNIYI